jgi:hypothetical protein
MKTTLEDMRSLLELQIRTGSPNTTVGGAYTSDLLSDVLAHAEDGDLLITIQAHKNTVAVSSHVGASAILVCGNRPIPQEMITAAEANGIAVAVTELNQFESSGRVYAHFASLAE